MTRAPWLAALLASSALTLLPGVASAKGEVEACLAAHERGQKVALEGKLATALDEYEVCGQSHCPKLVREDCRKRGKRARDEAPTLRPEVSGGSSEGVRISVDGADEVELDEAPIFVDPGEHRVRFLLDDGREIERTVTVEAGQRDVRVVAELAPPPPPEDDGIPPEPTSPSTSPAVYALGGVAVLGVAGFVGFGLAGNSKKSELDACKPDCRDEALYDDMHRSYVIADVALAVGIASAAVATYLYLDGRKSHRVGVSPSNRGALLSWDARF